MEQNIYDPALDPAFSKPYIDIEEQRPEGYTYVHGGFEGTDTRFSFFYPPKEQYEGRFFQFGQRERFHRQSGHGKQDRLCQLPRRVLCRNQHGR